MRKMVPVPLQAVNKLARYLALYPEMKGQTEHNGGKYFN
jgi:hypothetical protein